MKVNCKLIILTFKESTLVVSSQNKKIVVDVSQLSVFYWSTILGNRKFQKASSFFFLLLCTAATTLLMKNKVILVSCPSFYLALEATPTCCLFRRVDAMKNVRNTPSTSREKGDKKTIVKKKPEKNKQWVCDLLAFNSARSLPLIFILFSPGHNPLERNQLDL